MLDLLRAAVAAKQRYWDASLQLERVVWTRLGYDPDDIPDNIALRLEAEIEWLSACMPEASHVTQEHVDQLLKDCK